MLIGPADGAEDEGDLARQVLEMPAAVLVLDLDERAITAANPAGRHLAPECPLPAGVGDWLRAARLRPPDGPCYEDRPDPISRIADGLPVHEAVRLRDSDERLLRVTGVPVGRKADESRQAVVVFDALAAEDLTPVDRAVRAAGTSFTLSDPRLPDDPLVFANPAFERTTGYSWEEVAGRNCRFLQGPDTDRDVVRRIGERLGRGEHCTVTLLNYRKDGSPFWNELALSPVYDGAGLLTQHVGIQTDVTVRVLAQQESEAHLRAERRARTAAERAQRQLALLAEATTALAATLDVDDSMERLSRLVVPLMADWCTVQLVEHGDTTRISARHRDTGREPLMRRLEVLHPRGLSASSFTERVLRGGKPVLVDVDDEALVNGITDPELRDLYREIGVRSAIVVPLRGRQAVLGVLTLLTDGSGRTYDEDDLFIAADLARRAALAIDNVLLYQREHAVAEQLQRSLLPQLPVVPGVDSAARYLPSSSGAQVGGDWYDVFPLPDGTLGIAVGDVMGHDMTAAAAMGQLRSVLRSYAWQGDTPAVVLDRLDQLVQGLDMAQLATCVYGRIDLPAGDGAGRLRLCNAGHLPPVLRSPDGTVRLIGGPPSLLVGAALGTTRSEVVEPLGPGSVLVLCTDGLVEHRDRALDDGLAALQAAVASAPATGADAICDHLLAELAQGRLEDDVALLVLQVRP